MSLRKHLRSCQLLKKYNHLLISKGTYKTLKTALFVLVFLPFFTLSDFYPFLRISMFAEPAKKANTFEQFRLLCVSKKSRKVISNDEIGLQKSSYNYALRNLYYKNELEKLTSHLFKNQCKTCTQIVLEHKKGENSFSTVKIFRNE